MSRIPDRVFGEMAEWCQSVQVDDSVAAGAGRADYRARCGDAQARRRRRRCSSGNQWQAQHQAAMARRAGRSLRDDVDEPQRHRVGHPVPLKAPVSTEAAITQPSRRRWRRALDKPANRSSSRRSVRGAAAPAPGVPWAGPVVVSPTVSSCWRARLGTQALSTHAVRDVVSVPSRLDRRRKMSQGGRA